MLVLVVSLAIWVGGLYMMPVYGNLFWVRNMYMMPWDISLTLEEVKSASEQIPMFLTLEKDKSIPEEIPISLDTMTSFPDTKEGWRILFAPLAVLDGDAREAYCFLGGGSISKPLNLFGNKSSGEDIVINFDFYAECLKFNKSKAKVLQKILIKD
jgi:hypothetical protein